MTSKTIQDVINYLQAGNINSEIINNAIRDLEDIKRRTIIWSIGDFEQQAINHVDEVNWEDVYDKTKFEEALYRMISKHDANFGISWGTVDYYLNEYCTK